MSTLNLQEVLNTLQEARGTIKEWHNMGFGKEVGEGMWSLYQNSPEMRRLNGMIQKVEGHLLWLEQQRGASSPSTSTSPGAPASKS